MKCNTMEKETRMSEGCGYLGIACKLARALSRKHHILNRKYSPKMN